MGNRLVYVDALKGIAIFMVVMSHIYNFVFSYTGIIYNFITIIDLPLFFFISGFLLKENSTRGGVNILRKVRTLLVPFIAANLLLLYIRGVHTQINSFDNAYYGTWFLLVLFECFFIFFIARLLVKKCFNQRYCILIESIAFIIIIIGLYFAKNYCNKNCPLISDILSLSLLVSYFPYFWFGYLFKRYNIEKFISNNVTHVSAGIAIILFAIISKYTNCANFITFSIIKICSVIALYASLKHADEDNQVWIKPFAFIGSYSLEIYLIHFYLLFQWPQIGKLIEDTGANWGITNIFIEIILCVTLAALIISTSILLSKIFIRNTIFKICIGR